MPRPTSDKTEANKQPTVSYVGEDGTLVELVYDSSRRTTALAVRHRDGRTEAVSSLNLASGEHLVPYSATNNLIATNCVLLPSGIGPLKSKLELVAEIQAFLHRYVDLTPAFEEIAAHYVLLTWIYDSFNEIGYLRFRGDYGTGKTRALLAVGSLSYKPFFASGASTVSPLFHVLDTFGGTLVLDEADFRFSDATADLTKILNNGNVRGLPVLRTMTNRHQELNPTAFRVFGPKLVAMRESFSDPALESRFLTEETGGRPLRRNIPIQLPDSLAVEALQLRNKLLAWRFATRFEVGPDPSRLVEGVEPRLNQTALALLSIVDDEDVRARIRRELVGQEARVMSERASSVEATMLAAVVETFAEATAPYAPISEILERFSRKISSELYRPMSPKQAGFILRTRLRLTTVKTRGVYVVPQSERPRIEALTKRYGVGDNERAESAAARED